MQEDGHWKVITHIKHKGIEVKTKMIITVIVIKARMRMMMMMMMIIIIIITTNPMCICLWVWMPLVTPFFVVMATAKMLQVQKGRVHWSSAMAPLRGIRILTSNQGKNWSCHI